MINNAQSAQRDKRWKGPRIHDAPVLPALMSPQEVPLDGAAEDEVEDDEGPVVYAYAASQTAAALTALGLTEAHAGGLIAGSLGWDGWLAGWLAVKADQGGRLLKDCVVVS